jgi:hypothetical protein
MLLKLDLIQIIIKTFRIQPSYSLCFFKRKNYGSGDPKVKKIVDPEPIKDVPDPPGSVTHFKTIEGAAIRYGTCVRVRYLCEGTVPV